VTEAVWDWRALAILAAATSVLALFAWAVSRWLG
jgi:hypothetical protein